MKVFINDIPLRLHKGGRTKDALNRYQVHCGLNFISGSYVIRDVWGNEVAEDGALNEGSRLYLSLKPLTEK